MNKTAVIQRLRKIAEEMWKSEDAQMKVSCYAIGSTVSDALALLRDDQSSERVIIQPEGDAKYSYRCGYCVSEVKRGFNYCPVCGTEINWD